MYEFHGYSQKDRIYRIWVAMRQRCEKAYRTGYGEYGARGIKVCEEWSGSFTAFRDWAFANGYDEALTIDRIKNDKGYEPGNCRWATPQQQSDNRGNYKNAKMAEHLGENLHLSEWARRTGIGYTTLVRRYNSGKRGDQLFAPVA